ncbi:expressed unknown protein [Ectocarpus siliculosus]|uniref:Uncharacterized protein n=1 Tax=Ectocarpus siliculosus TaxID=2880 RepID=D7FH83_ECTSI|nr:expressed unknown protein [Ectocarpus siliculosus]|eukprot:CBJ28454.1 expressed unknown protein [Ectocarpus siliculosus]
MICMEDESMYDGVTVCPPAAVGDSWNVSSSSARTSPHPCTLRFAGPIPATSTLNRLRRNSVVGKTGQGRARERGEESGRRRGGTTEVTKHNGMDGDEGSGSARPGVPSLCWKRRLRFPLPLLLPFNRPRLPLDLLVTPAWKPSSLL